MNFRLITQSISRLAVLFALIFGAVHTAPAWAVDLDQARSQGLVGERPDGLVGAVPTTVAPDVLALVDSVNTARLNTYRDIASKNNTPVDAVQAIAGEKQVQKARENGWYYMDAQGAWKK
ncbi:MAG: YdbL family protein [Rhodobacteraceae bacterium]|nr:YdbL family protein [Geminicoccaceae bacterium]MCB2108822.1 YdbL family protein [Paracoccaceae bacterium]